MTTRKQIRDQTAATIAAADPALSVSIAKGILDKDESLPIAVVAIDGVEIDRNMSGGRVNTANVIVEVSAGPTIDDCDVWADRVDAALMASHGNEYTPTRVDYDIQLDDNYVVCILSYDVTYMD